MADLTITAANVIPGEGAVLATGLAGDTITAGDPVYKDASDNNEIKKADADSSSTTAALVGIAVDSARAGQQVRYQSDGILAFGAILTVGEMYFLSPSGGIMPYADLANPDYTSFIGIAVTTSNMDLLCFASGALRDDEEESSSSSSSSTSSSSSSST